MNRAKLLIKSSRAGKRGQLRRLPAFWLAIAASFGLLISGCNSVISKSTTGISQNPSQLYFSPNVGAGSGLATYAIDHTATPNTFVRSTYSASGALITDAGSLSTSNGIDTLGVQYIYGGNGDWTASSPGVSGGWAVELPGQAALIEMNPPTENVSGSGGYTVGGYNYFTPAVPTESCPNLPTAQTFQFVTIPEQLPTATGQMIIKAGSWNPALETAYGSVDISTSGAAVTFSKLAQNLISADAASGDAPPSYSTSATAACSPTYFGQVISIPGTYTVTSQETLPTATIGIGPSGFLVEDSGAGTGVSVPSSDLNYQNILGAGYGAVGLPQPSSDITSSLTGAQYQGFLYAPGGSGFIRISNFGGSNVQATCAALISQLKANSYNLQNPVYGGEYTANNPTANPTANCDVAIDLGAPSAKGLYPNAYIYVGYSSSGDGSSFPGNGALHRFSAVAVGGQLQGKDAILLIGADTAAVPSLAWGVYLLQSN